VTGVSPAEQAIRADLDSARFQAGVRRGQWRQVSYTFPVLIVAVTATEPDASSNEYCFRFELTGFPGVPPEARIWNPAANAMLENNKRPKGSARVTGAFKAWDKGTVYRPWDRLAGAHGNWTTAYPTLAWNPKRDLTFALEDLHGLLTSNTASRFDRPSA
jgi:hypothetical protein